MLPRPAESILRIARSDSEGDFVLVNVSSNGSSPLDLKLLATEGDSPFVGSIKQSRISRLRDKRNKQTDAEWEAALSQAFVQSRDLHTTSINDAVEKLEVIAQVAGGSLAIKLRNNISGITQGLGEIILKQDDDQEIDVTSWALTAVETLDTLKGETQELAAKYDEQSKIVKKLNEQLKDLIEAKKKHENAMLEKFRELLNAKKLKIRDQQRVLAGAKIDGSQIQKLQAAREAVKPRTPVTSRQGKRKLPVVADESSEETSEKEEPAPKLEDELSGQHDSPLDSGNHTTEDQSENSDNGGPSYSSMPDKTNHAAAEEMQSDSPPPRRELPFGDQHVVHGNSKTHKSPEKGGPGSHEGAVIEGGGKDNDEDSDDEDDDEL